MSQSKLLRLAYQQAKARVEKALQRGNPLIAADAILMCYCNDKYTRNDPKRLRVQLLIASITIIVTASILYYMIQPAPISKFRMRAVASSVLLKSPTLHRITGGDVFGKPPSDFPIFISGTKHARITFDHRMRTVAKRTCPNISVDRVFIKKGRMKDWSFNSVKEFSLSVTKVPKSSSRNLNAQILGYATLSVLQRDFMPSKDDKKHSADKFSCNALKTADQWLIDAYLHLSNQGAHRAYKDNVEMFLQVRDVPKRELPQVLGRQQFQAKNVELIGSSEPGLNRSRCLLTKGYFQFTQAMRLLGQTRTSRVDLQPEQCITLGEHNWGVRVAGNDDGLLAIDITDDSSKKLLAVESWGSIPDPRLSNLEIFFSEVNIIEAIGLMVLAVGNAWSLSALIRFR